VITRCIIGAGPQGRVTLETWRAQHEHDTFVFLDEDSSLHGTTILGAQVIGTQGESSLLRDEVVIAIGHNWQRIRVSADLSKLGAQFGRPVHPTAMVSPSAAIGEGTIVHPAAIVHTQAEVGKHVLINTGAIIEHDCAIGDGASLGPGVRMGGRARVGAGAFLSTGVTVAARAEIGEGTIVGAGAVVIGDLPSAVLAYGVPARPVRPIDETFDFRRLL
jgi:sugar O-acyltransferase (sialic acid O-acetyltransferase NeuD family)